MRVEDVYLFYVCNLFCVVHVFSIWISQMLIGREGGWGGTSRRIQPSQMKTVRVG